MVMHIPLRKLYARSAEDRSRAPGMHDIVKSLARSIEVKGLVEPLQVMLPHKRSKGNWYRVIDGVLRLRAIQYLVSHSDDDIFTKDYGVACHVIDTMNESDIAEFRASMSGTCKASVVSRQKEIVRKAHLLEAPWHAKLFPRQEDLIENLKNKEKIFYASMPRQTGKMAQLYAGVDLGNQDESSYIVVGRMVSDAPNFQQVEKRAFRPGVYYDADFAALETRLFFYHASLPTKLCYFDLEDRW